MNKQRNAAIDFLRIGAATLIVLHHYQQGVDITFRHITFYGGTFNFGYIVELFFLISGLMIYKNVSCQEEPTFGTFIGGKIKRIIPLLAISVLIETILRCISEILAGQSGFSRDLLDIVVNAAGLQTMGLFSVNSVNQPTWYLSVLLLCYFWLFVIIKISKRFKFNSCYGFVFMVLLGITINTYSWNTVFLNRYISRGYFSFFAGLLLAYYFHKVKKNRVELVCFILPVMFLVFLKMKPQFLTSGDFYFYTLMLWIPVLVFVVRWLPARAVDCKIVTFLGKVSFGVYIWNEPMSCLRNIMATVFAVDLCKISTVVIFVMSSWLIAICSYLWIEKPISKRLRRNRNTL